MTSGPQPAADIAGALTAELYDVAVRHIDGSSSTMPRASRATVAAVLAWLWDRDSKPLTAVDPESGRITVMPREHVAAIVADPIGPSQTDGVGGA
jgi:hypothetical protein